MKKITLTAVLILGIAVISFAQKDSTQHYKRGKSLTTEQKKELKGKMKDRYDSLSPEQQKAFKQGMKAARERYKNMTPEEKAAAKEKFKAMKNKYDSLPPEQQEKLRKRLKDKALIADSSLSKKN
jgi:uncharacterized membrane protein